MYSCESFLDYAYEGEEALEGFGPNRTKEIVSKLVGVIKRLIYRIQKLMARNKSVDVPENIANAFKKIMNKKE